jgi:SAM-dependent methyltransferase
LNTTFDYTLLKLFCKREQEQAVTGVNEQTAYSKLDRHIPSEWRDQVRDRIVLDFGCGLGHEMIQLAHAGARKVYGLEISEKRLREARQRIEKAGLADTCIVVSDAPPEQVDCIFSFDCFEHFEDPGRVLRQMHSLLKAGGKVYVSFGPSWFHPLGGHAFSPFPWAHLLLNERALVRWRNLYFPGHAVGFNQSGLNRMTIKRFFTLCEQSEFTIEKKETVPIRGLTWLHNDLTREWISSVTRAILRK